VESLENAVKRGRAGGTLPVKAESLKNAIKRQRFKGASWAGQRNALVALCITITSSISNRLMHADA
jgi:hypothetical protein